MIGSMLGLAGAVAMAAPAGDDVVVEAPISTAAPASTSAAPASTPAAPASTSAAPASTSAAPASTSAAPAFTSAAPASTPAAPAFVSAEPGDAEIARQAWEAAAECTGRPGRAHPRVELLRGAVRGGYLGLALHDAEGLYRIELSANDDRLAEVIVHEVAHAWVTGGPPALTEGRTELLADCIVTRRPGLAPLQWDDGRDLSSMPDLRTWSNAEDHGPAVLADQRTDAYLGASRLLRTAALLVDERMLWPEEGLDWEGFAALLEPSAEGRAVLEVLHGGSEAQRAALDDADVDGLPTLAEQLLGTDPVRWDSDADGWWDGSVLGVPARSVALPLDGTPVCSGLAGAGEGGGARVVSGGNLRGVDLPSARLRAAGALPSAQAGERGEGAPQVGEHVAVGAGEPVLVELVGEAGDFSGGVWARVRGPGLTTDPTCTTTPELSIWATDPAVTDLLPQLIALIDEAASRAEERWGPAPGRVAVSLGGPRTTFEDNVLYLSSAELARARSRGGLTELAGLAVSLPHTWRNGTRDWTVAEALARSLWRPTSGSTASLLP